ncbi:MAG TPA: hypothetical protein V6D17_14710 [Candidatus Obscuribacterales bacterium]
MSGTTGSDPAQHVSSAGNAGRTAAQAQPAGDAGRTTTQAQPAGNTASFGTASQSQPVQRSIPSSAAPPTQSTVRPLPGGGPHAKQKDKILKGGVSKGESPFLEGVEQEIPAGCQFDMTMSVNLNSEINQKGDEILARVACDVKKGEKVLLPGGWYMRGIVTNVQKQKLNGRDAYVEVTFDRLVSPDGDYQLPFDVKISIKSSAAKSLAKTIARDSAYMAKGALLGSLASVQLTGVPMAVMTNGYSVAGGAAIGAAIGAFHAFRKKGNIASYYPGDALRIVTGEPIKLPGFDPSKLPSAKPKPKLSGLEIRVNRFRFDKSGHGDEKERLLRAEVTVTNNTSRPFSFFNFIVKSDYDQMYPQVMGGFGTATKKIEPGSSESRLLTFSVDGTKRKYSLILVNPVTGQEVASVPIN